MQKYIKYKKTMLFEPWILIKISIMSDHLNSWNFKLDAHFQRYETAKILSHI